MHAEQRAREITWRSLRDLRAGDRAAQPCRLRRHGCHSCVRAQHVPGGHAVPCRLPFASPTWQDVHGSLRPSGLVPSPSAYPTTSLVSDRICPTCAFGLCFYDGLPLPRPWHPLGLGGNVCRGTRAGVHPTEIRQGVVDGGQSLTLVHAISSMPLSRRLQRAQSARATCACR